MATVKGVGEGAIPIKEVAAPGTPPTGYVYVYPKSDGKIYRKDDTGAETELGGGASGHFTTAITQDVVTLTDGANIATNAALSNRFKVTLGGNRTLSAPTNPTDEQQCVWLFIQDGTGNRTITLDTGAGGFKFGSDITAITLSTAANKRDRMTAIYDAAANKWEVVGIVRGY